MKKTLIFVSLCLCAGSLTVTGATWAKKKSDCSRDADVVLSKQFPHFEFDADNFGCAQNDAGDCDPDSPVFFDDGAGQIYLDDIYYGEGLIIDGTNRNNTIHGSSGPDVICGGNGNDEIWGGAGADVIYGDNGKDALFGGLGNDVLHGGNGKDDLSGYDDDNDGATGIIDGEDDDVLNGDNGKDELTGGPGDDILNGGNGSDNMDGGDGMDLVNGDKGKDDCVDSDDNEEINECEANELDDARPSRRNRI